MIISIVIIIYFYTINRKINTKLIGCITIIILLGLVIIAFMIQPNKSNDLYRHFEKLDIFRNVAFEATSEMNDIIGAKILFYIISLLPSNHFLPVVSVIITYGILFYIIKDFAKNKYVTTRCFAISVLLGFSICDYISVVSGIRNTMAFAFIALALYKDLIKNEKGLKIVWPYVIAVSIHPSAWIVIVARLILGLKYSEKIKYLL